MNHSADETWMRRCFELAERGLGYVSPNPLVGAVLVYQDQIIGEGYHERYGEAHAEVNCLNSVHEDKKSLIASSTLYVSLEPCSHYGKTPPCTKAILEHQIKKVVIGCKDFSDKVNGKGIALLRDVGIEVITDVLKEEAIWMNRRFFTAQDKNRPYIILKWAQSMDGFMGREGERIWISSEESRKLVHVWRAQEDAIWVGYQTALIDNPELNVRLVTGRNPLRVVYDRDLSLPSSHHIFQGEPFTLVFNSFKEEDQGALSFQKVNAENWFEEALRKLCEQGIQSIIIEGGRSILSYAIQHNLWDEARILTSTQLMEHGISSPLLHAGLPVFEGYCGTDQISYFVNPNQSLRA